MKPCEKCGHTNHAETHTCKQCGTRLHKKTVDKLKQMPPTYFWQAILVTILCCLPLGIPAIIYAAQVENRWRNGDIDGALRSSKNARNFAFLAFVIGLIVHIIHLVYLVFIVGVLSGGILSHYFGS